MPIWPGESGQLTDVSHESLQEQGINGVEYNKRLGSDTRRDTEDSAYAGAAYGPWKIEAVIKELERRVVFERNKYARDHGISEQDASAKIGVAQEVIGERQASQCFRFTDEKTYPTGNLAYGTPTPKIFAKNRGQILLTGVDYPGKAAVVEAHGARYNFSRQKVKLNHQDTASDCEVPNGEP